MTTVHLPLEAKRENCMFWDILGAGLVVWFLLAGAANIARSRAGPAAWCFFVTLMLLILLAQANA